MKILVTGASGLLGRQVYQRLRGEGLDVVGLRHANASLDAGYEAADLSRAEDVKRLFDCHAFTHVIHGAAVRSPEECLSDPERAYRLNAVAVEYLAREVARRGAWLCHVSTDYVFDGACPPFREEDAPNPKNLYGRTKLAGEFAARTARRALILRIPALYRADRSDPRNVLAAFANALLENCLPPQDEVTVRYYTLVEDVAGAIRFALGKELTGTLHVTANQKTSKYQFARMICRRLGLDEGRVKPCLPPVTEDERPLDSHLSDGKYRALGGPAFRSIDEALSAMQPLESR